MKRKYLLGKRYGELSKKDIEELGVPKLWIPEYELIDKYLVENGVKFRCVILDYDNGLSVRAKEIKNGEDYNHVINPSDTLFDTSSRR